VQNVINYVKYINADLQHLFEYFVPNILYFYNNIYEIRFMAVYRHIIDILYFIYLQK
jgi:hypothetical protein